MLSAGNLIAFEDAGSALSVRSRLADSQILKSNRTMGTGKNARERRILYQYSLKRAKRSRPNINLMAAKAEPIAPGTTPMRKTRFLKVVGAEKSVNQTTIDRASQLSGIKG